MSNDLIDFQRRLGSIDRSLSPHQAILISTPSDITYFSGFETLVPQEREALLVITKDNAYLCHAHFSPFTENEHIKSVKGSNIESVRKLLGNFDKKNQLKELFIDESSLFVNEYKELNALETVSLKSLDRQLVWDVRMLKDETERELMATAAKIAKEVMAATISQLHAGQTEIEVRDFIENELKKRGSTAPAFPTIVAFAKHSALPHHQPTKTALIDDCVVLIDLGATYRGYRSDMTRTVWCGKNPSEKFILVEQLIHQAYDAAKKIVKKGAVAAKDLDNAARGVISQAGYGERFIHTTGHGLGLDIHEQPSLNWHNDMVLVPSMTITIEPGIYFEGEFGYRYENTFLLTASGAVELTL